MTLPSTLHQALTPAARRLMDAFRFVLMAPSHAGNIGSVVRAMATMGLADLVVVNPREADFRNHPQARALASGARELLAAVRHADSLQDAVADCELVVAVSASPREFGPLPRTPVEIASLALEQLDAGTVRKVAMVFGTERTGLLIGEMALCQQLVSIPADPDYSSLNLSQAAQIIAFSLRQQVMLASTRQSAPERVADFEKAQAAEAHGVEAYAEHGAIERLYAHLEEALVAIDYLDPDEPKKLMARMRRLFSRTRLEASEVDLLRGVCKQMQKVAAKALVQKDR